MARLLPLPLQCPCCCVMLKAGRAAAPSLLSAIPLLHLLLHAQPPTQVSMCKCQHGFALMLRKRLAGQLLLLLLLLQCWKQCRIPAHEPSVALGSQTCCFRPDSSRKAGLQYEQVLFTAPTPTSPSCCCHCPERSGLLIGHPILTLPPAMSVNTQTHRCARPPASCRRGQLSSIADTVRSRWTSQPCMLLDH
jgi:hypothetical protein